MAVSMAMKLWKGKTTFKGYKTSKGYEASEPSFQPYYVGELYRFYYMAGQTIYQNVSIGIIIYIAEHCSTTIG